MASTAEWVDRVPHCKPGPPLVWAWVGYAHHGKPWPPHAWMQVANERRPAEGKHKVLLHGVMVRVEV